MLGRVAVHISEEDVDYLGYVKQVLVHFKATPSFIFLPEEGFLGEITSLFTASSEERRRALRNHISEFFEDFILYTPEGSWDEFLEEVQYEYDTVFVKYRRLLFRKSIPEKLLTGTEGLRLWVYKEGSKAQVKSVCLPVDFSERSIRQLEFAKALREHFDFNFRLLYAMKVERFRDKLSNKEYSKHLEDRKEEVRHMYADLFGDEVVELQVIEGDPYRDMVKFINSSECDLVIVGRRGRGMRESIGSVSLHLLRSLKCPVVVL